MKNKKVVLNKERDVTISSYLITDQIKPTFLICPGGSYKNCDESEGVPIAKALNEKGFNVFILRYSVGEHYRWPRPIEDYDSAIRYLNEHQAELHVDVDHIIAIGLSAGGHVVSCAASIAQKRPFAAILCYPLVKRELLDVCAADAPDSAELAHRGTSPCFIVSSRNDWIVALDNTTSFIQALQKNFIDFESHIYGYAFHGFSIGKAAKAEGKLFCTRINDWFEESLSWIEDLVSGRYVSIREGAEYNDRFSQTLSTRNSCKLIYGNPGAAGLLKKKFPIQNLLIETARKNVGNFTDNVSIRNVFEIMDVFHMPSASEGTVQKMDAALSQFAIENRNHE